MDGLFYANYKIELYISIGTSSQIIRSTQIPLRSNYGKSEMKSCKALAKMKTEIIERENTKTYFNIPPPVSKELLEILPTKLPVYESYDFRYKYINNTILVCLTGLTDASFSGTNRLQALKWLLG